MPEDLHSIFPGPVLVLAGPGTGKTYKLAERTKWLIEDRGVPPDEITLITFTVEAARNMRARLSNPAEKATYLPRSKQPATIRTTHSLGHELLSQHAADVGLTSEFRVLSSTSIRRILFGDAAQLVGARRAEGRKANTAKLRATLSQEE